MPSSSRRKQSKPQHLTNDQNENQTTSEPVPVVDQSSQDIRYKLKHIIESKGESYAVTNGYGSPDYEDDDNEDALIVDETKDLGELGDIAPQDLSSKVKVTNNDLDLSTSNCDNSENYPAHSTESEKEELTVENSRDQHSISHSKHSSQHCPICHVSLLSGELLQHHLLVAHNISHEDASITPQQNSLRNKRPLDDDDKVANSGEDHDTGLVEHSDIDSAKDIEMASKRFRGDVFSSQRQFSGVIPPHLTMRDVSYDSQMKAYEAMLKTSVSEIADQHVCQVCSKIFPKPSDLKRHMMCHTGEKPFRCQYCNKPFRAKSSMHYHLKATHGLDIELSPGLEERYLRMKTRAQMNLLQRNQLTGLERLYGSESVPQHRDHADFDDVEDDAKSTDSVYQSSVTGLDLSSETLSQGISGQTGNDDKAALDLSMSGVNKNQHGTMRNGAISTGDVSHEAGKMRVQKETVLITRLDGLDLLHGENSSIFKCYLCNDILSSMSKMQSHLALHHQKTSTNYQCCFCDEIFNRKFHMQEHMKNAHALDVAGLNQTKDSLTASINGNHSLSDGLYSCTFCHKDFDSMISLHRHIQLHARDRNYWCRICGKVFSQYTSLQVHVSRLHWKTVGKSKHASSWVRSKLNLMNAWKLKPKSHRKALGSFEDKPLNLINKAKNQNTTTASNQNVTVVLPQSPLGADDVSDLADTAISQHSSENNWSESLSDNPHHDTDDGDVEIRSAPKRSLLPMKRDSSPRSRSSRKSTPINLSYQNHSTSDDLPLNFSKSDRTPPQDSNNNESSNEARNAASPELHLPITGSNPESIMPGYALNSTNHMLMAKALAAHQSLTHHLNNTSQPMIFPPNHLPPSLAAMNQIMSLPVSSPLVPDQRAGTSKSPSPASHSSSRSDTSPEERDSKEGIREGLLGYPRVQWGQDKAGPLWSFNMYSPPDSNHTDGRKVSSLSRTHSRLGIVQSPINRESMCKPTTLTDGRTVYKCPFCSKEFVSFSDINRHMDFHEDIRPYKCHYCDYYARTNSQLKVHMMRHQGIREFCCKLCNYKGVTQSDLNRHMKSQIHLLKSRNACSYCGEGFVTTKNLEKHLDGNCIVKMQKLHGGLDIPLQERVA